MIPRNYRDPLPSIEGANGSVTVCIKDLPMIILVFSNPSKCISRTSKTPEKYPTVRRWPSEDNPTAVIVVRASTLRSIEAVTEKLKEFSLWGDVFVDMENFGGIYEKKSSSEQLERSPDPKSKGLPTCNGMSDFSVQYHTSHVLLKPGRTCAYEWTIPWIFRTL